MTRHTRRKLTDQLMRVVEDCLTVGSYLTHAYSAAELNGAKAKEFQRQQRQRIARLLREATS